MRCTGSSIDPRAVKVTGTENGTQPEKLDLKSEFSGCILSLMSTGARAVRVARARRAGDDPSGTLAQITTLGTGACSRPNRALFETLVRESPCIIRIHARVSQKMQCSENMQNSNTISNSGL